MHRSSIIATVVAAGGVLVAGSVASVAVINAASTTEPEASSVELVADGQPLDETSGPSTPLPAADASAAAVTLPPVNSPALPEVPVVAAATAEPSTAEQSSPRPSTSDDRDGDGPSNTDRATRESTTSEPSREPSISADRARAVVMKQGDGVSLVSTRKESHGGYATYAVTVKRANGEVITGFVDRASGVVIDWAVVSPAPQPAATGSDDGYEDDDRSDEADDHDRSDEAEDHEDESDDD